LIASPRPVKDWTSGTPKNKEVIAGREAVAAGTATAEQIKLANRSLGLGAIESACRQYQRRLKRIGQFWITAGNEALLCLETFRRNAPSEDLDIQNCTKMGHSGPRLPTVSPPYPLHLPSLSSVGVRRG
jgi:hypothetical protein